MNLESKLLDGKSAGYCSSSEGEDEPWTVARDDDEHQAKVMSKMGTSGNTGPKGVLNDYKDFLEEQKREKAFKTKELLRQAKRGILTGTREDREAAANDSDEDDLENLRARRLREMQKAAQGRMAELTEKSQFTSIIDTCRDQLLGILLYEPGIESCNKISHVCKILACDYPQVKFARVKSTTLNMSKAFTEKAIPSLQFYQNGELVGNFVQLNTILGLDYDSSMLKRFLKSKRISLDKGKVVSDSEPLYQQPDFKDKNAEKDDMNNNQRCVSNVHKKRTLEFDGVDDLHLRIGGTQLDVTNGHISTRLTDDSKNGDPSLVTLQLSTKKPQDSHQEQLNKEKIRIDHEEIDNNKTKHLDGTLTNRRAISRLDFGESLASRYWKEDPNFVSSETEEASSIDETPIRGYLRPGHPARTLPPIDLLFLFDSSSSIGITNFDAMKMNIIKVLEDVDIAPGRSRVALIQYAQEPSVVFGFDKYYSLESVKKGINRMSYTGGSTMLAKALSFAAGILYKEQNMKDIRRKNKMMPTPRHNRLQILCLVSDGTSDDNIHKASSYIHEKLQAKVLGVVSKSFNKDKLLPITKYEGATFVMTHTESISIWLWRQQKVWAETYNSVLEHEKSLSTSHKKSHRN